LQVTALRLIIALSICAGIISGCGRVISIQDISTAPISAIVTVQFPPAVENLNEMTSRKARQRTNTYTTAESSNPYLWQPQTLSYTDVTTGHEVWRMSNTPAVSSTYHADIALTPWSANGKRMAYGLVMSDALKVFTGAYTGLDGRTAWMLANTDGSLLRPVIDGPSRVDEQTNWFPWSPILEDTYYMFGRTRAGNTGVAADTLYKAVVSDTGITKSSHINFGTAVAMKLYSNGLSQDGKKILATQSYTTGVYYNYPATVYPDAAATQDLANGYSINFGHDGAYWGTTPENIVTYHSAQAFLLLFPDSIYRYFFMPSGSSTWWKAQLTGSDVSGGPLHTPDRSAPYDFGEAGPENSGYGIKPYPVSHYWSHNQPDRWGKYMLYSDGDANPISPGIEDLTTHTIYKNAFGIGGVQHNDWHGWSDWFVSSFGASGSDYSGDKVYTANRSDEATTTVVAFTHTLYNNGGTYAGSSFEYNSIPRPAQSPDGTKIAFHSTFLNSKIGTYDNRPDIFWAVAYYPYPPEIKSASKSGSNVRITWDFNQGTIGSPNHTNPRTYSKRGWPNETADRPPSPREVKLFRIWRSSDNTNWSPVGTTDYNNCSGVNECGTWTETSWAFDVSQANNTTLYYAITSLEHSGLESHTLSNTWKVTLDGSGTVISQAMETSYPAQPGRKMPFYITSPAAPSDFSYAHQQAPATAAGQYTLTWTEPADSTLIRHYNIYSRDGGVPPVVQQTRIVSVPKGTAKYVDWAGDPGGTTRYAITSVDYQGNESAP